MTDIIERLKSEAPNAVACEHESFLAEAAIEIERLNGIYSSAVKGRSDFRNALVEERERSAKLLAALCNFADHKNWVDEVGNLQWLGKRHAIEYAQSVIDEVKY